MIKIDRKKSIYCSICKKKIKKDEVIYILNQENLSIACPGCKTPAKKKKKKYEDWY